MTQKGSLLPLESLALRSAAPTTNTSSVARAGLRVSAKTQQKRSETDSGDSDGSGDR